MNDGFGVPSARVDMWTAVLHYVLAFVLLYYAVDGQFSFDAKLGKTESGNYPTHGTSTETQGEGLQRVVETGSVLLVVLVLVACNVSEVLSGLRQAPLFTALVLWAFASAAWSQNPLASLRNATYLLVNTLLAAYLVKRFDPVRQVQLLVFVGVVFALLNLAIAVVLPRYGLSRNLMGAWSLEGICPHKNVCAYMSLFLVSPLLFVKQVPGLSRGLRIGYMSLVGLVVLLTHSRTGWLMALFLVAFRVTTTTFHRFERRSAILLVGFGSFLLLIGSYLASLSAPGILTFLGKDASLHGRTPIWRAVFFSIQKRPFTGYGFHAFWQGMHGESARIIPAIPWNPNNAHDGFLQVWVEVGAVALALIAGCIIKAIRDYVRCCTFADADYLNWYLAIIAATLLLNIDETELLGTINVGWTLFMVACLNLSIESARVKQLSVAWEREQPYALTVA